MCSQTNLQRGSCASRKLHAQHYFAMNSHIDELVYQVDLQKANIVSTPSEKHSQRTSFGLNYILEFLLKFVVLAILELIQRQPEFLGQVFSSSLGKLNRYFKMLRLSYIFIFNFKLNERSNGLNRKLNKYIDEIHESPRHSFSASTNTDKGNNIKVQRSIVELPLFVIFLILP